MVVAFEGMDGCGKSTVASLFAKENDFIHETQRIMKILDINKEQFDKLVKIIRGSKNKKISSIFYTFRCMLDNEVNKNTVVERTMISTYYFEKNNMGREYWDFAMGLDVIPDVTFILYAAPEVRFNRIKRRNPNDLDLNSSEALYDGYSDMLNFAKVYSIPYVGINTELYNEKQVVTICTEITRTLSCMKTKDEKEKFLKIMNNKYGFEEKEKIKIKRFGE